MNKGNLKPWKKGQSGNPGGISKARLSYRQAVEKAVSLEDFRAIVKALIKEAKKGKAWAVREFFDITLGKDFNLNTASQVDGVKFVLKVVDSDGKPFAPNG